ncbi:MAG TPA: response regulator [Candidatus Saccharimonadales bacterium]|nr:response regulator [Candidatus Saccharimonadales bacterium]
MSHTILIIEDEPDVVRLLEQHFRREEFGVLSAGDGAGGLEIAARRKPDLIILDLMLPELSGTEVLKRLKTDAATRAIPVVLLTARIDEIDRVLHFELGADDYVGKPFSLRELVLRVRAILRRKESPTDATDPFLEAGPIRMDLATHTVMVSGETIYLTVTEFRLLEDLVRAHGRVRSREKLLTDIWGYDTDVMSRTVDTHVRRLREKLGSASGWLQTLRGVGYRILDPRAPDAVAE